MGGRDGFLGAGFKAGLRFQLRVSSPPTTKPLGHTFLLDLLGVIQGFRSRQEAPVVCRMRVFGGSGPYAEGFADWVQALVHQIIQLCDSAYSG